MSTLNVSVVVSCKHYVLTTGLCMQVNYLRGEQKKAECIGLEANSESSPSWTVSGTNE